jgi:hypothetical protein
MAEASEKRAYPRVHLALPLTFRRTSDGPSRLGESLNVSANGMLFASEQAGDLRTGDRLSLFVALPPNFQALGPMRFLSGVGTVVRVAGGEKCPEGGDRTASAARVAIHFDEDLHFES